MKIETIIFDLDGTLIDTELAAAKAVRDCFLGWGIAIDPSDAHYIAGRTWARAFEFLFGKYKIPVSEDEAQKKMLDAYRQGIEEELIIVPGSVEAVQDLKLHFPLSLVSGSNRSEILWALGRLGILQAFQIVLGAEDYVHSKPAPDGYLKAMHLMGANPETTLIFEDSQPGIASAITAGAWVVAISGTNHFGQSTSAAHVQIPDLSGVNLQWVRDLETKLKK